MESNNPTAEVIKKFEESSVGFLDGRNSLPKNHDRAWAYRAAETIKGVVYHQSLEEYGTASGNARYHSGPNHIDPQGLPGLSYTVFIEGNGRVVLANDLEAKVFSQGTRKIPGDENALYLSVCVGGNFTGPGYIGTQHPTTDQLHAVRETWRILKEVLALPDGAIFGHIDFGKPSCPGDEVYYEVQKIRKGPIPNIKARQEFLESQGHYTGTIDAIWGPMSKRALIAFQEDVGLIADGVWGPKVESAARGRM